MNNSSEIIDTIEGTSHGSFFNTSPSGALVTVSFVINILVSLLIIGTAVLFCTGSVGLLACPTRVDNNA